MMILETNLKMRAGPVLGRFCCTKLIVFNKFDTG
jgi:hypothetical protein